MTKKSSKLLFLKDIDQLDYNEIGLKSGIEIHQQLNCGKLFSKAPCKIIPNEELDKRIHRKLRFSKSEDGDVDSAAMHVFKQQNEYTYLYNNEIATLVDLDEEPPTEPNKIAMHTAIQVGQMLNLNFFDEITFMRKLIIDGSITSGFQRTAMIGTQGKINTKIGDVDILGINVEEDSCRIISKVGREHIFALDRQGIPLIELTTGPNMKTPEQVQEVAKELGHILRSFSTMRRGIGTIRQDLNVSISKGFRVEIKGAQNLELIPEVVIGEAKRQMIMNSIKEECEERKIRQDNVVDKDIFDVTSIFDNTSAKVIQEGLKLKNSGVYAIRLYNMKGILGHEIQESYRFATEISNRNKKLFPEIKGLFHSDELPKYNISQDEVIHVYNQLQIDSEKDSFIILCHEKQIAHDSLLNIKELVQELILGPQEEVRQVDPKGIITQFLRPMPGSARMYPETDVFTIPLVNLPLEELEKTLPEKYDLKVKRLQKEFDLSIDQLQTLLNKLQESEVSNLLKKCEISAKELYKFVIDLPKDIKKRDNIEPIDFSYQLLEDLLSYTLSNSVNNQTIRDIVVSLYQKQLSEVSNLEQYLQENNLIIEQLSENEIRTKIKEIINNNSKAPFGALMGMCMKELSKSADGKIISKILKEEMN